MQNSRELILNMLRNDGPIERVGLCENVWRQTLQLWIEQGYPTDDEGKPVDPASHFGWDMAGVQWGVALTPLLGVNEVIEETDEWRITRNGGGAAHRRWKKRAGVPEHIDFRMTTREVWEADYRAPLLEFDERRIDVDAATASIANRRDQGRFALAGQMFIWENMRQNMGDVTLYQSLLADPDWIHDYGRVYTDFCQRHYSKLFEAGAAPDGFRMCEDLGYAAGLFCAPDTLRELIFPYFREMVDFFHAHDTPIFLHTCGDVTDAVDQIAEVGFDGMDPMEVKAGCDTLAFAAAHKDDLVFRGGLDARILEDGDRDAICNETTRLIDGMKTMGARYIFGSDHSISTNVTYDSYRYALDVYRERMYY